MTHAFELPDTLATLSAAPSVTPIAAPSAIDQIGFELGWDHAHHGLPPAAPYDCQPSALRDGLVSGRAAFGARTLRATPAVRQWLQLRLHAWLRGRSVELFQVTPNFLSQLLVSHCPITRAALAGPLACGQEPSFDRVRNDAGYAAGNLVVMSRKANHAKAGFGLRDAQQFVRRLEAGGFNDQAPGATGVAGLTAVQWSRVATLCSFVTPLPHHEACDLPLLLLPPNRLRLFNPAQALQAFVSRQWLKPGWSQRVARFEDLLPGIPLQRAFKAFFMALLPRVLEAGRLLEPQQARWAIEDAWRHPGVLQRWTTFARQLTAAQCEDLVRRAAARQLGTSRVECVDDLRATEGWGFESRGYVPVQRVAREVSPAQLGAPV